MRHISKTSPPSIFIEFLKKRHPKNWDDIHDAHNCPGLYRACRDYILGTEQNFLGGYTERPLGKSSDLHIDHYRKKGMNWNPDVTFDWNNLIVEERAADYGACFKDSHTSNKEDYKKLLNPVTDYPETLFAYMTNGEITVKDGIEDEGIVEKVNFTIARFNLNHPKLKGQRETIIKLILNDYIFLSDQEVREALREVGYPTVIEWALTQREILKN